MRKILLFSLMAVLSGLFVACNDGKCHISGTIPENYDGKKIFLVPLTDSRAEVVDSVVIKNGKFEFVRDTLMMAKILLDYHYRMGIQPLLVVVEPGNVQVRVDSISSAVGTPQNDSLQQWKQTKEMHDYRFKVMREEIVRLMMTDTVQANALKERADSFHLVFKNYTRQMAANLKEGLLHDFLGGLYPRTYKRVMPDSTVVEFDADTHEPIAK